jgi:hypothetical protein
MRFIDFSSARADQSRCSKGFQELFPDNSIETEALSRKKASTSTEEMYQILNV